MLNHNEVLFIPVEFANLRFPFWTADRNNETDPEVHFPELKSMPSYAAGFDYKERIADSDEFNIIPLDRKKVFQYVCLCYDKESPLWKKFMLDPKRKIWAAYFAGWRENDKGYYPPEIDAMLHCRNEKVNNFVIDFLKLFNDPDYAKIAVSIDSYFGSLRILEMSSEEALKDQESKSANLFGIEQTKQKIAESVDKTSDRLRKMVDNWLHDNNILLRADLYCCLDKEKQNRLKITPEEQVLPNE